MHEHFEQAEGFGAAVPAHWCLLCGCLIRDDLRSVHRMACNPETIAGVITTGLSIGR